MLVCLCCLKAIESREGRQPVREVYLYDEEEYQNCEWCGDLIDEGYDILPDHD